MGWFDEQIRQVKKTDQEAFEESILRMASAVSGQKNLNSAISDRYISGETINEILRFYRYKPVEIPADITGGEEQIEYCLRPYGIMRREILLDEGWYKSCFGPVLAFRKEDQKPVPLLPRAGGGYGYTDPESGKHIKLNPETNTQFEPEAVCFYRPLPTKKLNVSDLTQYIRSCLSRGDRILILGMTFLAVLIGLLSPQITRIMTGFVIENGKASILAATSVFLLCAILSRRLVSTVRDLGVSRVISKGRTQVQAALMMRLINLPTAFFRRFSSGELATRFNYIADLSEVLIRDIFATGIGSLMSLIYIFQIARFTPSLALPAIIVILATMLLSVITGILQMNVFRKSMEKRSKTSGLSLALISGVQKIKLAGAEKRAFAKWANMYAEQANETYNISPLLKLNSALMMSVSLIGTLVLYVIAVTAKVSPSEYISFNAAYGLVSGAFSSLSGIALTVAKVRPIYRMVEPLLQEEPESSTDRRILSSMSGDIELSNVYFRYNEDMPYVVDGMNLKIQAGEYIAITGTTGCGKSTLMRLLLGFETPERGAIYYDGKDMSKLDKRSLRRFIGAVTQDGKLFQGSIYSNITISAPQLSQEKAWEAAEIAGIADDIRAMPMKMHTVVSEGSGGISGGQRQRLMIARAVAPQPRILMFDEATSALDNQTQKQVSEALDRMKCTRIVIAHRLSTIKNCDRILMLDAGHIVEDGTYEELMAKGGRFADLVARQQVN